MYFVGLKLQRARKASIATARQRLTSQANFVLGPTPLMSFSGCSQPFFYMSPSMNWSNNTWRFKLMPSLPQIPSSVLKGESFSATPTNAAQNYFTTNDGLDIHIIHSLCHSHILILSLLLPYITQVTHQSSCVRRTMINDFDLPCKNLRKRRYRGRQYQAPWSIHIHFIQFVDEYSY